jgi:hypothetical protein
MEYAAASYNIVVNAFPVFTVLKVLKVQTFITARRAQRCLRKQSTHRNRRDAARHVSTNTTPQISLPLHPQNNINNNKFKQT